VTFAGLPLPAATIDCWELSGQIADGRTLSGHALVADQQVGPGGMKQTLIVFHGSGTLHGF
jgi:hypothetical protein